MWCRFSNFLLFGASVFSAIAAPTPSNIGDAVQFEKHQVITALRTIPPNYLVSCLWQPVSLTELPMLRMTDNRIRYIGDVSWDTVVAGGQPLISWFRCTRR